MIWSDIIDHINHNFIDSSDRVANDIDVTIMPGEASITLVNEEDDKKSESGRSFASSLKEFH